MNKIDPPKTVIGIKKKMSLAKFLASVIVILLLAAGYFYYATAQELEATQSELASSTASYQQRVQELEHQVATLTEDNDDLSDDLRKEKRRNQGFEDQIDEIAGTVSVLDKLRKTDTELLKKYSKVSFLNENYLPESLAAIDKSFISSLSTGLRVHTKAAPFLDELFEDAKDDKIDLRVASAYRSFGTQAALKSTYTVTYGSGANQFSADQGYSEHQLGTALDFTTVSSSGALDGFDRTPAYTWLVKNAYKYGFILSYPSGNAYYQFEPWHWRFVGVELATDLHRTGKNFYDMEQREIDPYLVNIFD